MFSPVAGAGLVLAKAEWLSRDARVKDPEVLPVRELADATSGRR